MFGTLGLAREIVEGEVAVVEFRQTIDRVDEAIAHADLNFHRNAFADINFMLGYFQMHEGRAVGREVNAAGAGSAGSQGAETRDGAIALRRGQTAAGVDPQYEGRRFRRRAGDGEDAGFLRRDADDGRGRLDRGAVDDLHLARLAHDPEFQSRNHRQGYR